MMEITNQTGLPEALVAAVGKPQRPGERASSDYTITELLSPPRQLELRRRHWGDISEDVAERIYAIQGTATHEVIRKAKEAPNSIKEERLYAEIAGCRISGQVDNYEDEHVTETLWDWKTGSVWSLLDGLKPEWEQQTNCYAHLYREASFAPRALRIALILRDWSKPRARREPDYPQRQVVVLDVPLWSEEKAFEFLRDRVMLHEAVRHGKLPLPECTEEERWQTATTYAVMKKGRNRALRVYDDIATARNHVADLTKDAPQGAWVEKRTGEAKRCADYCNVSAFCGQFQKARWWVRYYQGTA